MSRYPVIQWIRLNRLRSMATALIAIVLVVAILDYVSARVRQRVVAGTPVTQQTSLVRRYVVRGLLLVTFVAASVWSWQVSRIDLVEFVEDAPDGLRLGRAFLVPDMFTRPVEEREVGAALPVPPALSGSRVDLSLSCGQGL